MKSVNRHRSAIALLSFLSIATTAVIALALATPFLLWQLRPYRDMGVWVVDKTVPYPDYREHAGLFWILKNEKISKPGSRQLYDEKSDYFGFYPYGQGKWQGVALPKNGVRPEVIYLADTYGVYEEDFMQRKLSGELSKIIYGALTPDDIQSIRSNLGGGNTLIAEFNTAASPTNVADRRTLGRLLGIEWVGWIGKYFEELDKGKEIPPWMVENYETQSGKTWTFFGRGYVLISDKDEIVVLQEGEDVKEAGFKFVYRDEWGKRLRCTEPISYRYWFEWVQPEPGLEVVADYHFDLTDSGRATFQKLGLTDTFPAIAKYANPQYSGWYFAGDYADMKFSGTPIRMAGIAWLKRLLVDDTVDSNVFFFWRAYVPLMHRILDDADKTRVARLASSGGATEPEIRVRAFGKGFQMRDRDGVWKEFFVRGVNMGLAEPGKYFTEFPERVDTYARWFDQIAAMNANTIRVYTLPPPEFYKALYVHNTEKPDRTLFLLQEIWPEEEPENGDYLARDYREGYLKEIDYGIDAVYGRANIPERKGRAWGVYTADVSHWLLGWLVGRELESAEVLATNERNKDATYEGLYVSAGPEASPTEVWLAESLDTVASIESARYGKLHPVAIVSWPTLDPMQHDTEWDPVSGKKHIWNDRASVAIDHFEITEKMTAGIFGAYHIYPNYPDFMNNEPSYGKYKDQAGVLRYGGYLAEFMESHKKYPALVAEFGLANGAGMAHYAPDGLNHGGIDEVAAGEGILRMLDAIRKEGYAGGIVFEWMDEWVKKTWTTEPFMIPYDRHVLWHNAVDPEQNYGLLANDPIPPAKPGAGYAGSGRVKSVEIGADAAYLHVDIRLSSPPDFSREEIILGLDTLDRSLGQTLWPVGGLKAPSGLEFVVRIGAPDKADLLVIHPYNAVESRYATQRLSDGIFERMIQRVTRTLVTKDGRRIPELFFDTSRLPRGDFDEAGRLWTIDGSTIRLRLPWTRLNVTDPSSLRILQDTRTGFEVDQRDVLRTVAGDGFAVYALAWDRKDSKVLGEAGPRPGEVYRWAGWETVPPYVERLKKSYYILQYAWEDDANAESVFK